MECTSAFVLLRYVIKVFVQIGQVFMYMYNTFGFLIQSLLEGLLECVIFWAVPYGARDLKQRCPPQIDVISEKTTTTSK